MHFLKALYGGVIREGDIYQNSPVRWCYLGREDVPGTTLYGGVIWGRKMCQIQLYMVVLFGEGRCARYNSIWWCYLGKEDVPGTTVYGLSLIHI